jgi:hypothetical protein
MPCTPKKTVERLRQQQAHYLLCVKANHPKLYSWLVAFAQSQAPIEVAEDVERTHGRQVHRRVSLYQEVGDWAEQWQDVRCWLKVERWGQREGQAFEQTHYYLTDLQWNATEFLALVRGHWSIENQLHWPKDVVLGEDKARQRGQNAPANWSIVRNFFITLARKLGFASIAQAKRQLANQVERVMLSLQ